MMNDQENNLEQESLHALYAKTLYTLREARKALLRLNGVEEEAALLEKIRSGETPEHPGYDQYLGAAIMEQTRKRLREDLTLQLGGHADPEESVSCAHLEFQARLEEAYGPRFSEPVRMAQDALLLSFETGLMMEVRYVDTAQYAIRWSWGEAEFCLDTAPVHGDLPGAPAHLHRDDGSVTPVPVPLDGTDPWSHFSGLLDRLLADPLLGTDGDL